MSSPPSVVLLTGPVYIGNSLNWGLLGVLILQVSQFFNYFPNETWMLKAFVLTLCVLEVLHAIFITSFGWDYMVTGWGNPTALATIPWAGLAQPIMTGVISAIVQLFYAWRIWTLKRKSIIAKITAVIIALISLLQSVTSIVAGILFCFTRDEAGMRKLAHAVQVYLIGGVICDILIAVAMAVILTQARANSPKDTDRFLRTLLIDSIETGAVTAITALVDLILFQSSPTTNLHLCPSLVLSQLYSNTALASLNRRKKFLESPSFTSRHATGTYMDESDDHELDFTRSGTSSELATRKFRHTQASSQIHFDRDAFADGPLRSPVSKVSEMTF